jgi:hypothetical protein
MQAWCIFVVVLLHGSANGAVSTIHVECTDAAYNVTNSIWAVNHCSLPMVELRSETRHRRLVHASKALWFSLGEPYRHTLQCIAYAISVVPIVVGWASFALVAERSPVFAALRWEVCLALCCFLGTWMKIHQSGHTVSSLVIQGPLHWCHVAFMSTFRLLVPIIWLTVRGTNNLQRACLVMGSVLAVLHQDAFVLLAAVSIVGYSGPRVRPTPTPAPSGAGSSRRVERVVKRQKMVLFLLLMFFIRPTTAWQHLTTGSEFSSDPIGDGPPLSVRGGSVSTEVFPKDTGSHRCVV